MRQKRNILRKESVENKTTYLLFLLGGMLYATPALSVSRIANWSSPVKLPGLTGKITDVINIDESNIPLFEIYDFLGIPQPREKVTLKLEHTQGHVAIAVDEALTLTEIPDSAVSIIDKVFVSEKQWRVMNKCFVYNDTIVPILDLADVELDIDIKA
ncbi:MAG TPA: chemotaxis protein CheW [Caldisericia bacterium]|nr:chemotaxis protein CheW [Caldisericia bacterium]HPF49697.1 chemotaxis protein CheW [Caldisericia bacterium]HPI84530.1 chemotaxis protein CheW [Caldisericia bacterium]HPQ93645.1 chemotaxis protein CheW [Caldisericia bacterium]HRV74791.1 chemotaxis protein CheW [Caldisericia bacterium]